MARQRSRGHKGRPGRRERARRGEPSGLSAERVLGAIGGARGATTTADLARRLGVERAGLKGLRGVLRALLAEGRIEHTRGHWRRTRPDGLVEGVVARDGASLTVRGQRLPVDASSGEVRPGDRVLVQPAREGGGAEVLHVVDGYRDRWVGIFDRSGSTAWITPYRDDAEWSVRIARADWGDARPGEVVAALPVERPGGRKRRSRAQGPPFAKVVERLGRPGDPEADFAAVVWRHRLPVGFPEQVLADAEGVAGRLGPADLEGRADLRDRPFVTIDPHDARDHDDAVWVEADGQGGFTLSVAIADVAHYVEVGSAIDKEALRRGNSVYFPERAIPMLPERLSTRLCSLRPDEDRLAVVVTLRFDSRGRRKTREITEAVIRSRARLVYEDVAEAIAGRDRGHPHAGLLADFGALTRVLHAARRAKSLDLDLPEPRFVWSDTGRAADVQPAERTLAHRAVEEAMLAANRAVAEFLTPRGVPVIHRVHEPPAPTEVQALGDRLQALGLLKAAEAENLDSAALSRALARAEDHPAGQAVHFSVLRAMKQARYAVDRPGHFALGFSDYLHFTSPIRRYADLVVHRVLKGELAGRPANLTRDQARRIATRVSFRERLAAAAERERIAIARCALMAEHVGEEVTGRVTGIAPHGLYVTLDPWYVEGLVHVSRLPGYFTPDALGFSLVSHETGLRFGLGDRLLVRVARASPVDARIDLDWLERLEEDAG